MLVIKAKSCDSYRILPLCALCGAYQIVLNLIQAKLSTDRLSLFCHSDGSIIPENDPNPVAVYGRSSPTRPTINFIDKYCASYRNLFSDVRSFEAFTPLHVGMLSPIERKTLPAIAEVVGLANEQSLNHFLTKSPWQA